MQNIQEQTSMFQTIPMVHCEPELQVFLYIFHGHLANNANNNSFKQQLLIKWMAAHIPANISHYLLNFQLIKTSDNSVYIVLTDNKLTSHDFINQLTKWFHTNGQSMFELLTIEKPEEKNNQRYVDILTAILAPGARLTKDGTIMRPLIEGLSVNLPCEVDREKISLYREFVVSVWQELQKSIGKIEAYLAAPGSTVEGHIEAPTMRALAFNIDGKGTPVSTPANNIAALRERDPRQPFSLSRVVPVTDACVIRGNTPPPKTNGVRAWGNLALRQEAPPLLALSIQMQA